MKKLRSRSLLLWGFAALLLAILFVAIPAWRHLQKERFIAEVERLGGTVVQDSDNWSMWQKGLAQLLRKRSFTTIGLHNCPVDDDWLAAHRDALARFPLVTLSLGNSGITDEALAELAGLNNITHLGLPGTQITDEGLQDLAQLSNLQTLVLASTSISDAGLEHLKQLRQLRFVHLVNTHVTQAGVDSLRKALPMCDVHWPQTK